MDTPQKPQEHFSWSNRHLLIALLTLMGVALAIVLPTAPFFAIMGPSTDALGGALHGLFSFLLLIVSTIALYLGLRLFANRLASFPDLQLVSTVMAILSLITIAFGNWIYIAYRAKVPESPRSYFLQQMPEVHKIFFEFKEYVALFTLPLSVAAAFIVWRYGRQVLVKPWPRVTVAVLIALHFFYFAVAFVLGAAVTKLKSI